MKHFASTLKATITLVLLTTSIHLNAQLSCGINADCLAGTAFNDCNSNGNFDTLEFGFANIDVEVYDDANTLVATLTTDVNGWWQQCGLTVGANYRVEYAVPLSTSNPRFPSHAGSDNGSDVQFTATGSCANFGLLTAEDYCQQNPYMVTPCFVQDPATGLDVLVRYSYDNVGTAPLDKITIAETPDVGALWGVAYSKTQRELFTAATLKRHVRLGTEGLDVIYSVDPFSTTPSVTTWLELTDDLGIAVSSETANPQYFDNTTRGLDNMINMDTNAFSDVGKVGIGDIEVSSDETSLFVLNMFDKTVYEIDIATKLVSNQYGIPDPGCNNGQFRPWALGKYDGNIFVGAVCDGSSSGNPGNLTDNSGVGNLSAVVYELQGGVFTEVLNFPLDYEREPPFEYQGGCNTLNFWKPWTDVLPAQCDDGDSSYPSPILTDIEFDDTGDMILGFTDRFGMQTGPGNNEPTNGNFLGGIFAAGEILKACKSATAWVIEGDIASCASPEGLHVGVEDIDGYIVDWGFLNKAGEFYEGDYFHGDGGLNGDVSYYPAHPEITIGGLAVVPCTDEVLSTCYDPVTGAENFNTGGVIALSNTTGKKTRNGFQLYSTDGGDPATFGKSVGLGDLEALCNLPPLEIGNYVWEDANDNGLQDASELGIDGMIVQLYDSNGLLVGQTVTSNGGYFAFNQSNVDTTGITVSGSPTPNTSWSGLENVADYFVVFGVGQYDGGSETFVFGGSTFEFTNSDVNANANDNIDSDLSASTLTVADGDMPAGLPVMTVLTPSIGSAEHSIDLGLRSTGSTCPPSSCATITVTKN